MKIYSIYSNRY